MLHHTSCTWNLSWRFVPHMQVAPSLNRSARSPSLAIAKSLGLGLCPDRLAGASTARPGQRSLGVICFSLQAGYPGIRTQQSALVRAVSHLCPSPSLESFVLCRELGGFQGPAEG